jgi:hypothetical protein
MRGIVAGQKQLSEYESRARIHIPYIGSVSSLNLRMGRGEVRKLKEPIGYKCSICKRERMLGGDASVLVRMEVDVGQGKEDFCLCDECIDVLAESVRFGPRVVESARTWKMSTRVARVAAVHEELVCFKCMGRSDSHLFVKFDDLSQQETLCYECTYGTVRVCARCALSYLGMMRASRIRKWSCAEMVVQTKRGVKRVAQRWEEREMPDAEIAID